MYMYVHVATCASQVAVSVWDVWCRMSSATALVITVLSRATNHAKCRYKYLINDLYMDWLDEAQKKNSLGALPARMQNNCWRGIWWHQLPQRRQLILSPAHLVGVLLLDSKGSQIHACTYRSVSFVLHQPLLYTLHNSLVDLYSKHLKKQPK